MKDSGLNNFYWYTLQTLSNQEMRVKSYIETLIKNETFVDHFDQVLVPSEVVTEVKNGKKRSRVRKFYPGYVFIRLKLYDENEKIIQEIWSFIRGIQGVIDFVGGQIPARLKKDEIERILGQIKESEGKEVPTVQYEVGNLVKINDGPFMNLTGCIEEVDSQKWKLKVAVSMFGRSTPIEVEYWQVNRVES